MLTHIKRILELVAKKLEEECQKFENIDDEQLKELRNIEQL